MTQAIQDYLTARKELQETTRDPMAAIQAMSAVPALPSKQRVDAGLISGATRGSDVTGDVVPAP
jgi:hypothetical protein